MQKAHVTIGEGQNQVAAAASAAGDRFALWPRGLARVLLLTVLALMALAAITPVTVGKGEVARPPALLPGQTGTMPQPAKAERFDDLKMYDAVIARMQAGEGYYSAVVDEHRKAPFPLTPGMAVRLPTLAWIAAQIGPQGLVGASLVLLGAILLAWWRRLGEEPGGPERRLTAISLLLLGASFVLIRYFHVLHELWAGGLLVLAMALHRPGRWGAALAVAALAVAIRETALPFVLLAAAMALHRRDWREAAAWSGLAALFAALWALHLHTIALQVRPDDPVSASWLTLRGLSGALSALELSSQLRFLPQHLAGPVTVLAVLGWAGWRSALGSFATLLLLGYSLLFMIAGRPENYYWGALVSQMLLVGLAFTPLALRSLWRRSFGG